MLHRFWHSASFHQELLQIDTELAEDALRQGCPHCGGRLHRADYPRLAFGIVASCRQWYAHRFSFCCGGCRRRVTPPSVRFFGRRRFVSSIFVLVNALRAGVSETRCRWLQQRLGVRLSLSTWQRWRRFWRHRFTASGFWQQAKAEVPTALGKALPRVLLSSFQAPGLRQRLVLLLRFVSPLSGGAV